VQKTPAFPLLSSLGIRVFMALDKEIKEKIQLLEEKYSSMGQDLKSYLDGLLYADYLTYWDYIHLDTLLSLQNPRTQLPDETIFIMYHQITELYFKLCLHELHQLAEKEALTSGFLLARVTRINRYFEALTFSFDIMIQGMEQEQFLKFRMSLLPASGFQSAQYRMIEICSTNFINLVEKDERQRFVDAASSDETRREMFDVLYWKKGATELATGNKTLTLRQFEQKYGAQFIVLAKKFEKTNLLALYNGLSKKGQPQELKTALRQFDVNVNVNWPLAHYKSAVRYLQRNPADIAATGGTNWQKYLPPRFQKRIFYPELWSEDEKAEWGKKWVETVVNKK